MTNKEMKKVLEDALGIEIHEERAAWILAAVDDKLRNEEAAQPSLNTAVCTVSITEIAILNFEYIKKWCSQSQAGLSNRGVADGVLNICNDALAEIAAAQPAL